ncbi:MAG: T9SS type A sorting domain-containing protein [Candidatus Marinimicrobia bacterium]|nr:T9SS type A sorting domain-containing protein [Candidatus Neomarinimicrobiota bacterium]
MYPLGENILFQYNDWFKNTVWAPSASDNFNGGKKWWAASSSVGGSTFRYITSKQNHTGGLQPGLKSLVEYARIQDQYINIDGSGIQRTRGNATNSTTRYSWLLNTQRNGMRLDSSCGGTDAVIHNVVSGGNKIAFRLKGDRHRAFHLLGYDTNQNDISMPRNKYCGDDPVNDKSETMAGNLNSRLLNSVAEKNISAHTPDAGDPNITLGNGALIAENTSNEFLLNQSGIWFGTALDPDHTQPGNYPHLELQDPWFENKTRSVESLVSQFGLNPYTDANQNYDFRPRKGSVLIDAGVVIPGINDGQNDDTSYPLNHPPSYSGQHRAFVGDAPDIGPYEYGDSVYWIPGFRYSYPSVPIPSDGAVGVSMEYGLAFNYPWKTDYTGTTATVKVSGPGINRTESFQYPNNVLFETFLPGETYNWSVIVDSVSSDIWTFTISDKEYPLNDRSLDTTIVDSMLIPYQTKNLQVSNNNLAFLKFDVPSSINNSYNIHLNLVPEEVVTLEGGIVVYKYNYTGWGEKLDVNNIGLIDKSLLTPIDTILSLIADSLLSLDLSAFIDSSGEHSFALGVLDLADNVSFYSKEKLITDGIDIIVLAGDLLGPSGNGSGYAPQTSVWPSLSFSKDSLSIAYDIPLEKEWNLISVPFTGVKTRPKQIFRTLIRKGLLEYVSSPKGYFKPKDPYSTLTSISSKEGYYLKLNGPLNKIFFRGRALTDKTISLSAGWNMIAYSPDYELAVDKAFENLIASNTLQYVTGFAQGALVYDPDAPQSSTLNTLKPTKGYWVKVNAAVTDFSFPAQTQGDAVGKIAANHSVKHPEVKPNPSFMFVKGKIMGRYNVGDWVKVLSEDNHVVGAAIITEGGYLQNSAVYGDDVTTEDIDGLKSGEKIAFVYDGDTLTSHVQFNPMSFHDVSLDYDTFLPTTFALYQNHPNPFNPITTIRYDLPENGPVSIIIYDLMGREIKTLVKQVSAPGRYSVNWNGRNQFGKQIASGMYFYRMETPEFQSVKKLIFLK